VIQDRNKPVTPNPINYLKHFARLFTSTHHFWHLATQVTALLLFIIYFSLFHFRWYRF